MLNESISGRCSKLKKAVYLLYYHRLPFGLISTQYLKKRNLSSPIVEHRLMLRAFFPSLQRPVFWLINLCLYVRWILYSSWVNSYKTVCKYGSRLKSVSGIGLLNQFVDVQILAIAHTVPPMSYYRFRLYERRKNTDIFNYVFDHEIPAFHLMRDGAPTKAARLARRTLSDKFKWGRLLRECGVEAACGELLSRGSKDSCVHHLIDKISTSTSFSDDYFFKPRMGSRSRGAFRVHRSASRELEITLLSGKSFSGSNAREFISQQTREQDYLVQPRYKNHPELNRLLVSGDETVTVRVISQIENDTFSIYCCYVEVPIAQDGYKVYCPLQIHSQTGVILRDSLDRVLYEESGCAPVLEHIACDMEIPEWEACKAAVKNAHGSFLSIYAIAWDLVITPEGPVILEGNSNWRIDLPQQLCGGLFSGVGRENY